MTVLSACGGGTEDPGDTTGEAPSRAAASTSASAQSGKPQASAEPQTSAKALSGVQLQSAVLVDADLSEFQMSEEMAGMPAPEGAAKRISPAECQPLLNIAVGKLEPQAKAFRYSVAVGSSASGRSADQIGVEIKLFALDKAGAEHVLAQLRTAAKSCAGYENGGYQAVAAADAPDAGDEAVAYKTSAAGSTPIWTTVVRSGATVVAFGHYTAELPHEVLSAQISKVEKVAG
ncbi:hypothetical protein ACWGH3_26905 [Streptomyces sp. NPDC054884]|uniref:hypothetical protein n=1 Tax=Streptomyces sp. ME08-AFT2 TaxID=3028683 RepID=UPI0029BDF031|nr:hypothetical protein [Streptomyces sp. ME08-AFT2]MDX3311501.1 hypothetical protein [Streptomyces sp. ME08-AFT2]